MVTPYEEGRPDSKICILAEAPARTEMRAGRPLVGPSGQLFDQCMHGGKIVRRECYLLNVFEDQVNKSKDGKTITDKDGEVLWTSRKGLSEAGEAASQGCRDRLSNSQANVVVPLGGTALSVVYDDVRIMKLRGSILRGNEFSGYKKLVPTVHPAACLRGQYLWRYLLISDLSRAKQESEDSELNLPVRELIIDPSFDQVVEYLHHCAKHDRIAFDDEVLNHQVSCISLATSPKQSMCIPFVGKKGQNYFDLEEETEIWRLVANIMADKCITKIGQNLMFDISFNLQQINIFTYGPIGDTMLAHHIIYPDFRKGLDFLCSMHTREPYYKDDRKLWSKPWLDLERFWIYNAKDSAVAFEIWDALEPLLKSGGYWDTYQETIEILPVLMYMMLRGMKVDRERLEKTKKEVATAIEEKRKKLAEASDYEFNHASPKQCIEYFYIHKSIKPYVSRITGKPSCDDKALSRIWRRFHLEEAKIIQDLRTLEKLHGTYLEVGIDRDDRIRCSYNPRGTTTGRPSSSQTVFGTGMNMQNLHPDFKGFLVADD